MRPVIDSHAHVFHRALKLAPQRRYAPDYDAPLQRYLAELDAHGVTHGVLVQPSFLGTANSYLVESLARAEGRLRGVAVVDPTAGSEQLDALDSAGVVGLRLNLVGEAIDAEAMARWGPLLELAAQRGWHVEAQRNAGDLATLAPQLLASGAQVVLDHFALPDPDLGVADPGFTAILDLAATSRLWVKISAPYRCGANGEALALAAYPLLREAFGLDRLLWGSDWPHTRFESHQDYGKACAFLETLVPDPAERARLQSSSRDLFRF